MAGDKKRTKEVVTREYTVNLHKALHGVTFKKKAPRAIKAVRGRPGPPPRAACGPAGLRARRKAARSACPKPWPMLTPGAPATRAGEGLRQEGDEDVRGPRGREAEQVSVEQGHPQRACCPMPKPVLPTPAATLRAEPRTLAPTQVPRRVRIQISRRRNDDEDAKARGPQQQSAPWRQSRVGSAALARPDPALCAAARPRCAACREGSPAPRGCACGACARPGFASSTRAAVADALAARLLAGGAVLVCDRG
jgi:hypothetical protein